MNPVNFLRKCHYRFLEQHSGHVPVSPGFHDIGGMYTSMSVTKRGIIDLPFHMNRLYQSSLFLDFFQDSEDMRRRFVTLTLQRCDEALSQYDFQEGLLIVCCGKCPSGEVVADISVMFSPKPVIVPSIALTQAHDKPYIVDFFPIQRNPAQVKYTRWVLERQPLIDRRAADVQETIIYDQDPTDTGLQDNLTEGLTSTFYILLDDGKILMPPTEKILYGAIQRWITLIAPILHLHIIERPITFQNLLHHAKGAFITSSGRILQPIHKMRLSKEIQSKYASSSEEIYFHYDDAVMGNRHTFEKLKIITFHLMYEDRNSTSSDLVSAKELKDIEEEVLGKIGYNPWLKPKYRPDKWEHELLEESLIDEVLQGMSLNNN